MLSMKFPKIENKKYKYDRYYLTNTELQDFEFIKTLLNSNDPESIKLGIGMLGNYPDVCSPETKTSLCKVLTFYYFYEGHAGQYYMLSQIRKFVVEVCEFKIVFIEYEV